jgi:hypothetical protein
MMSLETLLRARIHQHGFIPLNMSNTPKLLGDMQITNTRLVCWGGVGGRRGGGGEEMGAHENSNKEKLNMYLDLCNDKHAFGLVFRV